MRYQKNVEKDTTPFTPAVTLVLGLNESLKMIREEGIENTIARHSKLAEATRKGCEALGLKLFAPPEGRGSAVTPVWVPEGVDGKKIVKILKNKYGVTIAGGQDDYVGQDLPHRSPRLLRRVRHHHHARGARDDARRAGLRVRARRRHQGRRVRLHGRVGDRA